VSTIYDEATGFGQSGGVIRVLRVPYNRGWLEIGGTSGDIKRIPPATISLDGGGFDVSAAMD